MQKLIFLLTLGFLTLSCGETDTKPGDNEAPASTNDLRDKKVNWYEELMINYISKSDNELIKLSRKNPAIKIEWLLDRVENTDTAKYLIFHIGHDVTDDANTNMRFVTDGWVYIDSLTRKLYEYDVANDSLMEWRR
ncbi:MAG: hypothetical protein JWO09_3123 [Bacteroidetes bacterium]|nr:hypothetical protein [Bacteroidota bacterium]